MCSCTSDRSTCSCDGDRGRINVRSSRNDGTAYQAGYVDIDRSSGTEDKAHLLVALNNGSGVGEKLRITSGGKVNIGGDYTSTTSTLRVIGDSSAGSQTYLEKNSGSTNNTCLLYTSPSPRDVEESRMPSSA